MRQPMTIIAPPPEAGVVEGVSYSNNPREFNSLDRFAAELSRVTGFNVPIIEGSLGQAPSSGFLMVFGSSELDDFAALGPRMVLMDAARQSLWSTRPDRMVTDRLKLAAAVDYGRYFAWQHEGPNEGGGGIYGLAAVAERARMSVAEYRSPSDYGLLSCHGHCHGLAELLVHYLTVYEEMGLHERTRIEQAQNK